MSEAEPVLTPDVGPLTARFDLLAFTDNLITDLQDLRAGKISVQQAKARADLAKQTLKAVSLVVQTQKILIERAKGADGTTPGQEAGAPRGLPSPTKIRRKTIDG